LGAKPSKSKVSPLKLLETYTKLHSAVVSTNTEAVNYVKLFNYGVSNSVTQYISVSQYISTCIYSLTICIISVYVHLRQSV